MRLRDYQEAAVDAVWRHLREKDTNPCVVIPTAGGKSLCIAQVAKDAVTKWGGRVLCLAHVKELVEQNAAKISALCPDVPVGIFSAGLGEKATEEPVIVAGIQSIAGHADLFRPFDVVMVDECHLIPNEGEGRYRTFLAELKERNPNVRLVGWTATPYRTKGGPVCRPENLLQEVCYEVSVKELVDRGYISQLVSRAGRARPDLSGLHVRAGEFVQEDVEAAMGGDDVVVSACHEIAELTRDRRTCLVFCTSVKHCEKVAGLLRRFTGEECAVVTGDTPADERARTIRRLRGETVVDDLFGTEKGPLRYCCNVSVLTTGTDIPNIDTVVLLRPTASAGLFVQMIGRGFRLSPDTGKRECLVLDYGQNILRHGCADQISVRAPRAGGPKAPPPAKECPHCRTLMPASLMRCPGCGAEFARSGGSPSIDPTASTLGVLSGAVETVEHEVLGTSYRVWTKRDAPPGWPRTVRVDYRVDLLHSFSEWLCPEHSGYARRKFEKWWREHADGDAAPPRKAEDVCELAEMGALRRPLAVTVRITAGAPYPEVVGCRLGPSEMSERADALRESGADADELPF